VVLSTTSSPGRSTCGQHLAHAVGPEQHQHDDVGALRGLGRACRLSRTRGDQLAARPGVRFHTTSS
jgi:hypothetical protein